MDLPSDSFNTLVRPPIFSFISDKHLSLALPIIAYWVYSGFFHILDLQTWSWLDKYRIHPAEEILKRNRVTRWEVVRDVLVQQLLQTIVGVIVLHTEADEGIPDHQAAVHRLQLPPWNLRYLASAELVYWFLLPVLRQAVAVLVLDAWEYWIHRLMHVNKFLYRHLHSRHHRLYVPYAFGALYNHPIEGLILDTVGSAVAMKVAGLSLREAMFFFVFATMKTVDDHCGWNLPLDPFQFLFSNNSVYHDVHHQQYGIKANFSQPFFTFWDRICGTYMAPPSSHKTEKEVIVVQEFGSGAIEGSRKRRKSIVSSPTKANGSLSPKISGVDAPQVSGSPRLRKSNGIGSRGMLVVGK